MDHKKYNRSITLICPTCGCDQYEFEGSDGTVHSAKCTSCYREFTKDELIEQNSENISEHVKEMGQEITKDLAREMRDALRRSFRDSKTIKFK